MKYFLFFLCSFLFISCTKQDNINLESPDNKISVHVYIENGNLYYNIDNAGKQIIEKSPLGIVLENEDFSKDLTFSSLSEIKEEENNYRLIYGKKKDVKTRFREQTIFVKNTNDKQLGVTFRIMNDGVAFAYDLTGEGNGIVLKETSGFKLPAGSMAFISPLAKAKSGWAKTNPSYEDHYQQDIPIGQPSVYGEGWVFPALFKVGDTGWILISETGVDKNYVSSHLADDSTEGLYILEFPHPDHNLSEEPTSAKISLPFKTPWRTITFGENLNTVIESTMAQDLVKPYYESESGFKPGKSTWSWLVYNDGRTTFEDTKQFIDMASFLNFDYCLIDAVWDVQIGRDKIKQLAEYATQRNVGLLLWYNSNGNWNDAPQSPIHIMNTRDSRRKEMAWMQEAGIKGIKVDFFGGDKQSGMKLYQEILEDANEFGLSCNFHGATLPRGWDRMFPNFATAEAVMGMEFCKFEQENADLEPNHCTVLPFTRNVFAPMDYTPTVLNPELGEKPGTGSVRKTTMAFELALPVIFYSPIQHLGIVPDNMKQFSDFIWKYLSDLPTNWDDTKLIGGYPGKDVIMARMKDNKWFIAGINGEDKEKDFSLSLSFINKDSKAIIITDKKGQNNDVEQSEIVLKPDTPLSISVQNYGGFIIILE